MERGIQSMSDAHGLCLQDFVSATTNNGTTNDHLHNHHNLHDSVSSAVSVSSAITGLMSSGNNSLNHLSHDTSNHHHHHHSLSNTPALHEPLEKLKRKFDIFYLNVIFPWHRRRNKTEKSAFRSGCIANQTKLRAFSLHADLTFCSGATKTFVNNFLGSASYWLLLVVSFPFFSICNCRVCQSLPMLA